MEAVAFAGHGDILGAIQPQSDRASGECGSECGNGGITVGLHLFTTKSTAHPQALDGDVVGGYTKNLGNNILGLSGVLSRRVDHNLAVFIHLGSSSTGF